MAVYLTWWYGSGLSIYCCWRVFSLTAVRSWGRRKEKYPPKFLTFNFEEHSRHLSSKNNTKSYGEEMGSLNALNARPHDDGFLNPCRRTSKVFCKTHLGLREQARRRRVVESRLGLLTATRHGLQEKPWPAFRPWFTAK